MYECNAQTSEKTSKTDGAEDLQPAVLALGMFLGGVVILVLPRLTQSPTINEVLGPPRTLGITLLLVGFSITILVVSRMMFGSSRESDPAERHGEEERDVEPADKAPGGQLAAVAEPCEVMHRQGLGEKEIKSLQSVSDVEKMLDLIEWRRFEAVVERCFQLKGLWTSTKQHGADGGVDIKLYMEDARDELAGVVQCKHWGRRYVGVEQLRALRGSMAGFKAAEGYFVTSSTFTQEAMDFARSNQIETVDRDQLVAMVMAFSQDERESVLKLATMGRYDVPTCAACGTKMVKRMPRRGGNPFWGCAGYPRCRSVIRIGRGK